MHKLVSWVLAGAAVWALGCAGGSARGSRYAATESSLKLSRVVLYRNGVGYFERSGPLQGQVLSIRCRKDQINDILKSLTVVDRKTGQAVSVSMPLDPQRWANAALAILSPGQGSLARVLDTLRGTYVDLDTSQGSRSGRVLMVEQVPADKDGRQDQRVSLLSGDKLGVVLLSQVHGLRFRDGDVALQLHRSLDASAGEGMFKQVAVDVRLTGPADHALSLSYVVSAPVWQPTYRIVLPDEGQREALLQAWAVIGNTSGEDWPEVRLSLTSGAPIAFRYDLHTPREVQRQDMTARALGRQAEVAMGETTYADEAPPPPPPATEAMPEAVAEMEKDRGPAKKRGHKAEAQHGTAASAPAAARMADMVAGMPGGGNGPAPPSAVDFSQLQRSTQAQVQARRVSGLTQFDLQSPVTVPDGTSTMVAILNKTVAAEQAFLFRPGGSGAGYESNPYRVVRFRNSTPFVLEPGPISIYAGGSFVGEGIAEAIAADTSATIPFAVEPAITVGSTAMSGSGDVHLLRITGGTLQLESFQRMITRWTVRGTKQERPYRVLIRQGRYAANYQLKDRPPGTEDLPDGYLIPVSVEAGKTEGGVEVIEQTPARTSITIWDTQAERVLTDLLALSNLDPKARARLTPILNLRREIAQVDTEIDGLRRQQQALDQRASETRANLEAIKKDPRATALRDRLSQRLEDFTREGDALGRRIVELNSKRLEKKINMDEMLQNFEFQAPGAP